MTEKTPGETKHQHCSVCGYDNPEDVLNCKNCGTPLVASGRSHAEARKVSETTPADKSPEKPLEITNQPAELKPTEPKPAEPTGHQAQTASPDSTFIPTSPTPQSPSTAPVAPPQRDPSAAEPASTRPQPAAPPLRDPSAADPASTRPQPAAQIPPTRDDSAPPISSTLREQSETVASDPTTRKVGNPTLCPHCGYYNRPGTLICENCGTNLSTDENPKLSTASLGSDRAQSHPNAITELGTKPLPSAHKIVPSMSTAEIRAVQTAGADLFEDDMILRLEVSGAPTPILVYPSSETIIGRRDPISSGVPDVDLTAYAGYRMGVSRQHAVLRLQSKVLDIRDLGSSNGTFVNGVRLNPHQPHLLRDGDEVGLGKMVIKIFFQSGARRKSAADLTPPP